MEDLARKVVRMALDGGATDAECTLSEGREFSVTVRMREVERLKEAGARGASLRVLMGRRSGASHTSDLSEEGIRRMLDSALVLAQITSEDPCTGLLEPDEMGNLEGDLAIYSDDVATLETPAKIRLASDTEEAAFAVDSRIVNSEGATFGSYLGRHVFANSRGFAGSYRTSSCSLSAVPVARDGGSMERDYWYSAARGVAGLETPAEVGRLAAQRALRRLNPRKVATGRVPVVFEPRTARSLVEHIFEAVNGELVYRKASFLSGKLGERIAAEALSVVDDATLAGWLGTSPFDDEGAASRRTVVVRRGLLASYLLNGYTARKLNLKTTGNAARGPSGAVSVGHGNLYAESGAAAPEEIVKSVRAGIYVTELLGAGVNIVTGDYSRGAVGLWIENGELAYPVSEVTIAGNLRDMLAGIEAAGSDLEFRGSTAAPTLLTREMTLSGH